MALNIAHVLQNVVSAEGTHLCVMDLAGTPRGSSGSSKECCAAASGAAEEPAKPGGNPPCSQTSGMAPYCTARHHHMGQQAATYVDMLPCLHFASGLLHGTVSVNQSLLGCTPNACPSRKGSINPVQVNDRPLLHPYDQQVQNHAHSALCILTPFRTGCMAVCCNTGAKIFG